MVRLPQESTNAVFPYRLHAPLIVLAVTFMEAGVGVALVLRRCVVEALFARTLWPPTVYTWPLGGDLAKPAGE